MALIALINDGILEPIIEYLKQNPCNLNNLNGKNDNALMLSIVRGKMNLVQYFAKRVDINYTNIDKRSALDLAAMHGKYAMVKFLLSKGVNINNPLSDFSLNDIMRKSRIKVMHLLITSGCKLPNTVLLNAIQNGMDLNFIKFLIKHGANINYYKYRGNSLHYAITNRNIKMAKYLIDIGVEFNDSIVYAAMYNDKLIVSLLLQKGADVNIAKSDHKETALMGAIRFNRYELVKYLLKNNADPNIEDTFGNTAFIYACVYNNTTKYINLLLKYNIDIHHRNREGKNAINMNISNQMNFDIIKYLYDIGVDINNVDINLETPLTKVIKHGYKRIAEYLLIEKDVDYKNYNRYGEDALSLSIIHGMESIFNYIIFTKKYVGNANRFLTLAIEYNRVNIIPTILRLIVHTKEKLSITHFPMTDEYDKIWEDHHNILNISSANYDKKYQLTLKYRQGLYSVLFTMMLIYNRLLCDHISMEMLFHIFDFV